MNSDKPKICVDVSLPAERREQAAALAIQENPDNAPMAGIAPGMGIDPDNPAFMALITGKQWKPGRTLRVRFLEGADAVQRKVEAVAQAWSEFANIKLAFGDDPGAEIRISFGDRFGDEGSWSYIGTDALGIAKTGPTMNYGWLKPSSSEVEYNRVVLHEFGHALGCIHEHNSPAVSIPWDEEAVLRVYMGPPNNWTEAQVRHNVLNKYSRDITQFTEFDPRSIMAYPVPNSLTIGDFEVPWNAALSEMDKQFIRTRYPFEPRNAAELVLGAPALQAAIGAPGETDSYAIRITTAGDYVIETSGFTDVFMGLFGPDSNSKLVAEDDDAGKLFNARIGVQLAPGAYTLRVRHARPNRTGKYGITLRQKA